jgi:RND family efflux transporter MFP subunit
VDGDENTNISAKVPGVVTKVMVRPGSVVKAGQVIAQLDGDAIYKQIQAMEVNLNLVTDLYQKQKALWEKQVGSEIQFKQAKANKESLEQQLASMKEQYEMYQIKSPVDGTIDVVNLKIGQTAAPGFPYFSIVNFNKLKVKADVAENYANKVKQGNDVEIEFPDINKTINSTIAYSGKGISALNRTFSIEVNLPQDESYLPNMIAVVKIIDYRKDNAIVVPVNCIQTSDGNAHVFVVSKEKGKNVARKKFVKMGMTYNDKAEILEGLNPGDELVTVGYSDLNDGETIKF